MSHGPCVAAWEVVAVPVSTPAASTAVVPAASSARRARRSHDRTVMNELLPWGGRKEGGGGWGGGLGWWEVRVNANNRAREGAVRVYDGMDTSGAPQTAITMATRWGTVKTSSMEPLSACAHFSTRGDGP